MSIDPKYLDMLLAENPAVNPTDYSTGLIDMTSQPSLDDLMLQSNRKPIISAPITPVRQRIDPETMAQIYPSLKQTNNMQGGSPLTRIPQSVLDRAKMAKFWANISNFTGGLGRSGRNFRANPLLPEEASSAVINNFLQRSQSMDANRRANIALGLQKQRLDLASRPKPVDPIAQMKAMADLRTAQAGAKLKEREVEQTGTEEDRKKELVDMINASMEKEVATISMSLKTLEDMASDIGLDPLKLRRAKAAGGIRSGGVGGSGISREKSPELANALQESLSSDAKYIADPKRKRVYDILVSKDELSKAEARIFDDIKKEISDTKDRDYKYAENILNKVNDPQTPLAELLTAIRKAKVSLAKNKDKVQWNEATSTIRSAGGLAGEFVVDAWMSITKDDATKELLSLIKRVSDTFGRYKTGANMPAAEAASFDRQLQASSFSNPDMLMKGLNNAENIIRETFLDTWNTIPETTRPSFYNRAKQYLPYDYKITDEDNRRQAIDVANKYKQGG
jgi:hypothetical protein